VKLFGRKNGFLRNLKKIRFFGIQTKAFANKGVWSVPFQRTRKILQKRANNFGAFFCKLFVSISDFKLP